MQIIQNELQEITAGSNVIFDIVRTQGNNSIIYTPGSGLIKLRGLCCSQNRARFKVSFSGNLGLPPDGTSGPISLAIAIDGEAVQSTRMIVTPENTDGIFNISSQVYVDIPKGCCGTVSVRNIENQTLTVQNANLIIQRVA